MHLEHVCSGTRHDSVSKVAVPIIVNQIYVFAYLQQHILWHREKKKNKIICDFYAVLCSKAFLACLRIVNMFGVVLMKLHRMFSGKLHKLHKTCDE